MDFKELQLGDLEVDTQTLDSIKSMWAEDSKINNSTLSTLLADIANCPLLHSKYSNLHATTKLQLKKAETALLKLKKAKMKYYRGEMTKEDLLKHGWNQYQERAVIKSDMDKVLSMDDDVIALGTKVHYIETIEKFIDSVIWHLRGRPETLKTYVSLVRFMSGV